jgi:hypothetical protein
MSSQVCEVCRREHAPGEPPCVAPERIAGEGWPPPSAAARYEDAETRRTVGVPGWLCAAGALLLALGVFLPVVRDASAEAETKTFLGTFTTWSVLLLGMAAVGFLLAWRGRFKWLIAVGVLALAVLAYCHHLNEQRKQEEIDEVYFRAHSRVSKDTGTLSEYKAKELADSIYKLNKMSIESEKYGWSWALVLTGGLSLVAGGLAGYDPTRRWLASTFAPFEPSPKTCPSCGGGNHPEAAKCKHCGASLS